LTNVGHHLTEQRTQILYQPQKISFSISLKCLRGMNNNKLLTTFMIVKLGLGKAVCTAITEQPTTV